MRAGRLFFVLALSLNGCAWSYSDHFSAKPQGSGGTELAAYQLGKVNLAQGFYGLAEKNFTQAISKNPNSINALNGLAVAQAKLGYKDRALGTFEKALALDPNSPITLTNMAYFHLRQGEPKLALQLGWRATTALKGQSTSKKILSHKMLAAIEGNFTHAQSMVSGVAQNSPQALPSPRPRPELASDAVTPTYRVSNGAGIHNLAKRTADYLGQRGVNVAILSNEKTFDRTKTVIYYNPGLAGYAEKLAKMMPMRPRLVLASAGRGQVEVILGSDVMDYADQFLHKTRNA